MKYTFRPDLKGTHIRIADGVHGKLFEHLDSVTILPESSIVDSLDFILKESTIITLAAEPVPYQIDSWRAKAILEILGLLPAVESVLHNMSGEAGVVARAAWSACAPLIRNGPTVLSIAADLELSGAEVDSMFISAAELTY